MSNSGDNFRISFLSFALLDFQKKSILFPEGILQIWLEKPPCKKLCKISVNVPPARGVWHNGSKTSKQKNSWMWKAMKLNLDDSLIQCKLFNISKAKKKLFLQLLPTKGTDLWISGRLHTPRTFFLMEETSDPPQAWSNSSNRPSISSTKNHWPLQSRTWQWTPGKVCTKAQYAQRHSDRKK